MSLRRDVIVVALAACGVGFAASAAEDLIAAAQRNDTTVALAAIEDGIDVNLKSPDGTTALHWAVYNGNLALVERLIAGGADVILMPEIPYDLDRVVARIQERESFGARFSIVVVAEGAKPRGGDVTLIEGARAGHVERLGGIGAVVAKALQDKTRKETRHVVLGHLQRGGAPTAFDRVLATRFGGKAVELVTRGMFGRMVANHPPDLVPVPLGEVVGKTKTVPLDYDLVTTACALGVSFGD